MQCCIMDSMASGIMKRERAISGLSSWPDKDISEILFYSYAGSCGATAVEKKQIKHRLKIKAPI